MSGVEPRLPMQTGRLIVRAFEPGDLAAMLSMYSREDVARFLYEGPRDEAAVAALLERKIAGRRFEAEGDWLSAAIVLRPTGELIGDLAMRWVSEEHRQAEIGFVVHPDHQGLGYATEAAAVFLRIAFEEMGLHRVIGRVEARNAASARVLEKLGFRREAHLVENEWVKQEWQSELVYAILDREWRERAGR
jgi:RimJ/RimL family protein N-acetyltransferase